MRRLLIALLAAFVLGSAARAAPDTRLDGVRRVIVIPDVHGAYQPLLAILRETAVIDESLHWRAGDTHLVSLGDLLDRGPDSRQVLDLLMRLEQEAQAAGGALHLVLGNHEVMNIAGDLRYVTDAEYAAFAGAEDDALRKAAWQRLLERQPDAAQAEFDAQFPAGYFAHRQAFSPQGRYGRWLLTKPFLLEINDMAFAHGGLPPMVAQQGLDATNESLHAQLAEYLRSWAALEDRLPGNRPVGFLERPDALAALGDTAAAESLRALQDGELFTPRGPTWYRGQALCNPYAESENLDAALAKLGVARAVFGHSASPTQRVLSRFDGRVILLDAGMLESAYHGPAAALVVEGGRTEVAYSDRPGQRLQPERLPRAVGARPPGLDDDALAAWLAEAEIVGVEELDAGITQPQRVTLRKDGVELRAVFKQLSTDFGARTPQQKLDNADRFEFEVAAYRLDRLIGLDMVPVSVARTVGKRRGILQFWIDDSMNARHMIEQKLTPSGWCDAEAQYNLMNVFDLLVHNTDRTQENLLFQRDWTVVLIDHSRAFPTMLTMPRLLYQKPVTVPPALARRLAALDEPTLKRELGEWLKPRQIAAILKRRDRLLRGEYAAGAVGQATRP